MRTGLIGLTVLALVLGLCGSAHPAERGFTELLGIGGAGGMYCPCASPFDPELMFVCSDMSGSYRSTDGGRTWEMIHWKELHSSLSVRPCFTKEAIFWVSENTLKMSRDKGVTWRNVVDGAPPWETAAIIRVVADPADDKLIFVCTATGLWRTDDGGKTWEKSFAGKCWDVVLLGEKAFTSVENSFQVSLDRGKTWVQQPVPQKKSAFSSLTGAVGRDGRTVLYGTAFNTGVLQSWDDGKTWRVSQGWDKVVNDQNLIMMPQDQTDVAYVTQSGGGWCRSNWRTRDGGKTWEEMFRMRGDDANVELSWVQTDIGWGYYFTRNGLGICPGDPKIVMVSTQGDFYISRDGGDSWKQHMNVPVTVDDDGARLRGYHSNGLEVTTNWRYLFDPFDDRKTYIAYTDIGFARSLDRGKTWIWGAKGCPWGNTFYHVVFDPNVKGKMYAATSNRHDIPYWTHIGPNSPTHAGGVCVSEDHGRTWKVLGTGQPTKPCTWVAIDPKSPKDRPTLYATFYEDGVYRSTDGGATWNRKSTGLGHEGNLHAFMVEVHPKSGEVFCSITAHRDGSKFPVPGGLWKSSDGGENWVDVNGNLKLGWPCGFALHPDDPETVYLTAATIPGSREGGVYKTTDGGKTWTRVLKDEDFAATGGRGYVHANFVSLHPDNPDTVYVGSNTHGLWVSTDAGKTWQRFMKLPFGAAANVTFDPKDKKIMYVATHGGGVWKGHYLP